MTGRSPASASRGAGLAPHAVAAMLALLYAYAIFRSEFVRTGLQFVAPLLVVLGAHVAWIVASGGAAAPGFARVALRRTAQTAVGLSGAILVAEALAPMPSAASGGDSIGQTVLMALACLVVLGLVLLVISFAIYGLFRALAALVRLGRRGGSEGGGGGGTRANDVGALMVAIAALVAMSAEGVPGGYAFGGRASATATHGADADEREVWAAMGTATSPGNPLPAILRSLPCPVAVTVDEGVELGARRVVRIAGREGAGDLSLRVVERTADRVRLLVESDTSPMANWVRFRAIAYEVRPRSGGTRVSVTLEYERRLAPAWVFGPMMRGAAHLAADVLARDTVERAAARAPR